MYFSESIKVDLLGFGLVQNLPKDSYLFQNRLSTVLFPVTVVDTNPVYGLSI